MQLRFGADVRQRDGDKLANLDRVVFDPGTQQVISLVVRHAGFAGREVVVPVGAVERAEEDDVYVELSGEQFDQLPPYTSDRNLAPVPNVQNIDEDQVTDPVNVPDVPPVGAATGVESIAFTPIIQETVDQPSGDIALSASTEVWATDGHLGPLKGLEVSDQTNRIETFLVKEGVLFTHEVAAPAGNVASVGPDRIVLDVTKAALEE